MSLGLYARRHDRLIELIKLGSIRRLLVRQHVNNFASVCDMAFPDLNEEDFSLN